MVRRRKDGKRVEACGQRRNKVDPISIEELDKAERLILEIVQGSNFQEEVKALATPDGEPTKKTERRIHKASADPKMVKGLLYMCWRPVEARTHRKQREIPNNRAYKQHHIAELIILHYHQMSGHSGLEDVLSSTRQKYWIIEVRVLIRKKINDCFDCWRRQSPVGEQRMVDLQKSGVTPCKPAPFTYTGVDCFGPFNVRWGRSQVKRYGFTFTCLKLHVIHIEVASSLDTDSFLNAMRRFIERRDSPSEMRSDNGGNFVSAEKELRNCVNDWNH